MHYEKNVKEKMEKLFTGMLFDGKKLPCVS
jgi:hypothetical protein